MVPSRKVIKKDVIQCDAEVSKLLNIEIGDPVLHFCRVYYADEIPINYSDSYISLKDMLGLEKFDLEKLSLMHIMQNEYGLNIELIGGELEATVVKGKLKEYLKINEGFPLIKMTTVSGYNKRGLQHYSEYVISYYRTDTIKLTIGD
jgi:DNA-binding GntR family transcriptional regulator